MNFLRCRFDASCRLAAARFLASIPSAAENCFLASMVFFLADRDDEIAVYFEPDEVLSRDPDFYDDGCDGEDSSCGM